MNDSDFNLLSGIIVGIVFMGLFMGLLWFGSTSHNSDLTLSNETATDLCHNIANSTLAIPSVESGKLICTIPSYDPTQNVIIRKAGDK